MRLRSACLCFAVAALLPACGPGGDPPPDDVRVCCQLPPYPAVLVSVVNAEGQPVRDAVVTAVDETPSRQPSDQPATPNPYNPYVRRDYVWCENRSSNTGCDVWAVGASDGVFRVRAASADGTRRVEEVVSVDEAAYKEGPIKYRPLERRLVLPN